MDAIVSSLFHILCFPHEGRIVRFDQLDYSPVDSHATSDSTIPLVDNPHQPIENLGDGMYFLLMGIFDLLDPTTRINATELTYKSIVNSANNRSTPFSQEELDGDVAPAWTLDSTSALDCLDTVLPSKEEILEAMMGVGRPWEDLHHCSYFPPALREVESSLSNLSTSDVCTVSNPLALAKFSAERNMSVIS